jgi:hypothetical protein
MHGVRAAPLTGEVWRFCFADIGEVAIYCPECGNREFGAVVPKDDTA